ncbi:MAG: polysaccharide biosynthesis/export family protein [Acidobacteriota bacterium]
MSISISASLGAVGQYENESISKIFSQESAAPGYQVGPGDRLEISVFGIQELHQIRRVNAAGTIKLPLLGEIRVSGATPSELEDTLADLLKNEELVKEPQVSVAVAEYGSKPVVVLGMVNRPGQYYLTRRLNLIDVLSLAGGVKRDAAEGVVVIQWNRLEGQGAFSSALEHGAQSTRVDLNQLLETGDASLNLPIQGGEVIDVPRKQVQEFYVIGEVNRPGAFHLPEDRILLLSQALAKAGGPMKTAKTSKGVLFRYGLEGSRREIRVNVGDVLRGKREDLLVRANDVIFIPGSTFKNITYGMLGIIPRTVSETVSRVPN